VAESRSSCSIGKVKMVLREDELTQQTKKQPSLELIPLENKTVSTNGIQMLIKRTYFKPFLLLPSLPLSVLPPQD
jgi:hypothetical protein